MRSNNIPVLSNSWTVRGKEKGYYREKQNRKITHEIVLNNFASDKICHSNSLSLSLSLSNGLKLTCHEVIMFLFNV